MEAAYCGRDYERVETTYIGAQSRGYAVWDWGIGGGVAHVVLRARIQHEAGNWIIQTNAFNAFNSVQRKPMLEQVVACTPALTGFVAKRYGERPASMFFLMDSGKRTELECSRGVQLEDAIGLALFYLPLWPVLTRVREEYESQGVDAYAYLNDITIAAHEISPGTVGVVPFVERELTSRGIHLSAGKTVALAPNGHVPPLEEISLSIGDGVCIADEGGIKVVGVPVGTDEFAIESAIGIVRDVGAEQLARMLPRLSLIHI